MKRERANWVSEIFEWFYFILFRLSYISACQADELFGSWFVFLLQCEHTQDIHMLNAYGKNSPTQCMRRTYQTSNHQIAYRRMCIRIEVKIAQSGNGKVDRWVQLRLLLEKIKSTTRPCTYWMYKMITYKQKQQRQPQCALEHCKQCVTVVLLLRITSKTDNKRVAPHIFVVGLRGVVKFLSFPWTVFGQFDVCEFI